jgi:hypothetical protein
MELARYLLEQQSALDPQWSAHSAALLNYSFALFGHDMGFGVTTLGDQDGDQKTWGGATSKTQAISAMYGAVTGAAEWTERATRALAYWTYFIDADGCPTAQEWGVSTAANRGGWQEDAHTDVVHNIVTALSLLANGDFDTARWL